MSTDKMSTISRSRIKDNKYKGFRPGIKLLWLECPDLKLTGIMVKAIRLGSGIRIRVLVRVWVLMVIF